MPISSQAPRGEGSTTIPQGSTSQARWKRPDPDSDNWGQDIVSTSWKREAALKTLVSKIAIAPNGCWEWQGSKTLGYGSLKLPDIYGNFKIMAHRLSWVAFKGEAIRDGLFVCHKCDNPKCINPDHLFLGTQKDNIVDCAVKGRLFTCEQSNLSKYTADDIARVKSLLSDGLTGRAISKLTGISASHISRIRKGYTWKRDTASSANLVHANRKYSDEQLIKIAGLINEGEMSIAKIAMMLSVSRDLVASMKSGKAHKRFLLQAGSK